MTSSFEEFSGAMKYLHNGYILFSDKADYTENGKVDAQGIFDLFVVKEFPAKMNCFCVVGFGTPYERRQYKGVVTIENTAGEEVLQKEFLANDPADIFKGHYIFKPELSLDKEGMWNIKAILKNWKDEPLWDFERKFYAMIEGDAPPDP